MLLAAIDIGSNAVRLFFSNVFEQDGLVMVEKASLVRMPIRLGEDVFTCNEISEEKIQKLIKTMQAFKLLIEVNEPRAFKACATAAMREASNNQEVIQRVEKESGIRIEIIDGVEEANFVSAVSNLPLVRKFKYSMFVDVGGGSTEISVLSDSKLIESVSFKIGTVRSINDKVKKSEWRDLKSWLSKFKKDFGNIVVIGSGGNINKLNKLFGNVPEASLGLQNLEFALEYLSRFSMKERVEKLGLRPDRADVIIPAGEIFHYIMKQVKARNVYVPKIGLSDGIVNMLYRDIVGN